MSFRPARPMGTSAFDSRRFGRAPCRGSADEPTGCLRPIHSRIRSGSSGMRGHHRSKRWYGQGQGLLAEPSSITAEGQTIQIMRPSSRCTRTVFSFRAWAWESTGRLLTPFDTPVIVITAWDVLKHEANVSLLGTLLGKEARAAELNAFYNYYRNIFSLRTAGLARKSSFRHRRKARRGKFGEEATRAIPGI
jgi:hypothetical protein